VAEIPDKPFYKIGQLAPEKSRAGQRMYTRIDIDLVLRIKKLLYEEEFTIAGARKRLEQEAAGEVAEAVPPEPRVPETFFPEASPRVEAARPAETPAPPAAASPAERARAAIAETEIAALRKRIADLEARQAEAATALDAAEEARRGDRERREKVAARLEALLRSLEGPAAGGTSDIDRA
jgi:DNA-binding transcriptional MerR regulator